MPKVSVKNQPMDMGIQVKWQLPGKPGRGRQDEPAMPLSATTLTLPGMRL
jgi:hypothetical protein